MLFVMVVFRLHDTMIYYRYGMPLSHRRYEQHFEYMFILSKGAPKTFNGIMEDSKTAGTVRTYDTINSSSRKDRGKMGKDIKKYHVKKKKLKGNVWKYKVGYGSADKLAFQHPAIFPEQLAYDHIISWSNPGDTVLDPMMGSGTVGKMCKLLDRNFIGIDIKEEYVELAKKRIFS